MCRPRIGERNCSISAQIFSGVLAFFTRLRQIQITAMTAMSLDDGVLVDQSNMKLKTAGSATLPPGGKVKSVDERDTLPSRFGLGCCGSRQE
jgi:hypothetical protein